MSESVDAAPPSIRPYVMVLYWRAEPGEGAGDADGVFAGHMAYLDEQAARGRVVISGPFGDDRPLRGISIYDEVEAAELAALVATDPAVVAGYLRPEVRPWWSTPGALLPA